MAMARSCVACATLILQAVVVTYSAPDRFIATECFGNVLSLSCRPGHRIKVVDDFFGLSEMRGTVGAVCQYIPGDCTVTNNRYSSVVHRYCEGLESCTRFQVDRRNCGANLTNYEQVEYECVPDTDVIDICSRTSVRSAEGYISTPNFPNEYHPNSHCRCRLRAENEGQSVQLAFTQFIIKYDNPCRDWVDVVLDGETRRICGAYRSTLSGESIELVFHSDRIQGHQGFWLNFKAYAADPGGGEGGNVLIDCGPERYTIPSTTTTTTTPATGLGQPEATSLQHLDDNEWNRIEKRIADRMNHRIENEATTKQKVLKYEESKMNDVVMMETHEADAIVAPPLVPPLDSPLPQLPDDRTNDEFDNFDDTARRQSSRTTGIIIISICVGGIVLLVLILTVLLCVNKRKHPKRQTLSEKKEKIQQRLSSLSFYDSIPLYDSIGRKGGVARAPPVGGDRNGNAKSRDGAPCLPGAKCMPWKSEAPYWTTLHGDLLDSDPDSSTLYADLSNVASPAQVKSETTRKQVAPFAVKLDTNGRSSTPADDFSTHV